MGRNHRSKFTHFGGTSEHVPKEATEDKVTTPKVALTFETGVGVGMYGRILSRRRLQRNTVRMLTRNWKTNFPSYKTLDRKGLDARNT